VHAPEGKLPQVLDEFASLIEKHEPGKKLTLIESADFYKLANSSFVVVQSGERRFHGNIVLKKGVIRPDEA